MYSLYNKYNTKYHSSKTEYDGISFDSKKEAVRYSELKLLERCNKISNLELQKKFELIPAQYRIVNGKKTCIERACSYICDFYYFDKDKKEWVVEDVKGMRTDVYNIKKKLMLFVHNIVVKEI